jgi:hypothetical protein
MQNSLEKAFHVFNFPTVELRVNLGLRNPEDEKKEEEEYNRKKKRKEKLKVEITKKLGVVNHGEQSVGNYEGGIPDPTLDDDLDESNDEEETNEFLREKMEAKELEDYDVSDFSSDDEIVETDDILDDDIDDSESDEESDADKIKILEKNKTTKSSSVPPTTTGHPTPTTLTTTTSSVAQPEGIQAKRRTIQKREKPARKMRLKPKENANEEDSINKKKEKKEEGLVLSSRLQRHEKTTFSLEDFVCTFTILPVLLFLPFLLASSYLLLFLLYPSPPLSSPFSSHLPPSPSPSPSLPLFFFSSTFSSSFLLTVCRVPHV